MIRGDVKENEKRVQEIRENAHTHIKQVERDCRHGTVPAVMNAHLDYLFGILIGISSGLHNYSLSKGHKRKFEKQAEQLRIDLGIN